MDFPQVISAGSSLLKAAGLEETRIDQANFLDWAEKVRDAILAISKEKQKLPQVIELAHGLRRLRDEFDTAVSSDPMMLYRPQHAVNLAMHKSRAKTRWLRYANRSSKTTGCHAEIYWTLTGFHPYRTIPTFPTQAFIVGLDYTHYATTVFEPKFIYGEPGNALSPIFPENGKWFHSYDAAKRILELGCKQCAEAGQSKSCSHPHPMLILFSDEVGSEPLSGGQYGIAHLDEEVSECFHDEARERLKTVPNSIELVSLTPLAGEAFWTERRLTKVALSGAKYPGTNDPLVSFHTIDQFSAGLVRHEEIVASMHDMPEAQIDARIFGIPATDSEHAVFDLPVLREMAAQIVEPKLGAIVVSKRQTQLGLGDEKKLAGNTDAEIIGQAGEKTKVVFRTMASGWLKIFEPPRALGQYIIGADVAEGLTGRDRSVASVLRMIPSGLDLKFKLVAQFAGWIDPMLYAEELLKLGILYQPAWLNVEQNGPGLVCLKHLKDMGCWFMFRDMSNLSAFRDDVGSLFGTSTNKTSKSVIISLLQSVFKLNKLGKEAMIIPCAETLAELRAYVQRPTESGKSLQFEADGDCHDDRVMSLALAVYAAKTAPLYDFDLERRVRAGLKTNKRTAHEQMVWDSIRRERRAQEDYEHETDREFAGLDEGEGWTT